MASLGVAYPFSPWTQASLGAGGRALARSLVLNGDDLRAFTPAPHGPFTFYVTRGDLSAVGIGSSAGEALTRALAKLEPERVA